MQGSLRAAYVGAPLGLVCAAVQLIATVRGILDQQRVELIVCGIRTSAAVFALVSVGACLAALAAMFFLFLQRAELVFSALAVEAVLVVVWFLLDGDKAVGCTIG
jgi:hypothetical protein